MKIEPHADLRKMATTFMQMRTAFEDAGFTADESFQMIREAFVASVATSSQKGDE